MDSLFLTTPALVALSLCHLWFFFQFYLFTISTICNHFNETQKLEAEKPNFIKTKQYYPIQKKKKENW